MHVRLKAIGYGPGYVLATRADGKSPHSFTLPVEAFSAHNAEALALEQTAAKRAEIKQKLDEGAQYIADRAAERKRRADREAADEAERKRQARQAAKRKADNAVVNAFLKINSWRITPAKAQY